MELATPLLLRMDASPAPSPSAMPPQTNLGMSGTMILLFAIGVPALSSLFCGSVCYCLFRSNIFRSPGGSEYGGDETHLGRRPLAATKRPHFDIEGLPSFHAADEDKQQPCVICLEHLELEPVSAGTCAHTMHTRCLKDWLAKDTKSACPVCRRSYKGLSSFGFSKPQPTDAASDSDEVHSHSHSHEESQAVPDEIREPEPTLSTDFVSVPIPQDET